MNDKQKVIDTTRALVGEIDDCIGIYIKGCLDKNEELKDKARCRALDMMSGIEQQLGFLADYIEQKDDLVEFFFSCIGYFNHYSYFTKELWRKVNGFEHADEGEVKAAFLSLWVNYKFGIYTYPVGACWSTPNGTEESFNEYKNKWMPLFEDFSNWCDRQR